MIDFLQDPQKAYIFHVNRFLYILQKKSINKLCLRPHDTYFLFRTFFSQVNNKDDFFSIGQSPSKQLSCLLWKYLTGLLVCSLYVLFQNASEVWLVLYFHWRILQNRELIGVLYTFTTYKWTRYVFITIFIVLLFNWGFSELVAPSPPVCHYCLILTCFWVSTTDPSYDQIFTIKTNWCS